MQKEIISFKIYLFNFLITLSPLLKKEQRNWWKLDYVVTRIFIEKVKAKLLGQENF